MTRSPVDLWVDLTGGRSEITTTGAKATTDFVNPIGSAELGTLTSPLVFKQTAGNAESDFARDVGTRLFGAVFSGPAAQVYTHAIGSAEQLGTGVRLRIVVGTPDLQALPWELLYDKEMERDFVALAPKYSIVRHLRRKEASPDPSAVPGVLVVGSAGSTALPSPSGTTIDWRAEIPAQSELTDFPHVVHLTAPFAMSEVFRALSGRKPPRLLVLDGFPTDTAAAELAPQVPAVLGFRTGSDEANRSTFMRACYQSLAEQGVIEAAVAAGRAAVDVAEPGRPDWSFPVLYQTGQVVYPVRLHAHGPDIPEQTRSEDAPARTIPLRPELREEADYLELRMRVARTNLETLAQRWPDAPSGMPEPIRAQRTALLAAITNYEKQLVELT